MSETRSWAAIDKQLLLGFAIHTSWTPLCRFMLAAWALASPEDGVIDSPDEIELREWLTPPGEMILERSEYLAVISSAIASGILTSDSSADFLQVAINEHGTIVLASEEESE